MLSRSPVSSAIALSSLPRSLSHSFPSELADHRAEFRFGALIGALGDLPFLLRERCVEIRDDRGHGAGLGRQLLLRFGETPSVIAVHLHEHMAGRGLFARVELRKPLLIFSPFGEQPFYFLNLFWSRVAHSFVPPFTWRATSRMRAACSKLSIRWWATRNDGPTATAP